MDPNLERTKNSRPTLRHTFNIGELVSKLGSLKVHTYVIVLVNKIYVCFIGNANLLRNAMLGLFLNLNFPKPQRQPVQ